RGEEPFRRYEEADYLRFIDGRPRYGGVAGFLASRGLELPWGAPRDPPDRETVCGLGNAKNRSFVAHLRDHGARPFPTSVAFVRRLRERGLRTAAASASAHMPPVRAPGPAPPPPRVPSPRGLRGRGLRGGVVSASRNMVAVLASARLRELF